MKKFSGITLIAPLILIACLVVWTDYGLAQSSLVIVPGEFQVNTYTDNRQEGADVAMNSSGGFVATWNSSGQDGSSWGIYARQYNALGIPVSDEIPVNTYTTGSQANPSIAVDNAGNFVVVWESNSQDGSERGVYGQRFDYEGIPQGDEFLVNTYTQDDQYHPAAAMDAGGNFVVVWDCLTTEADQQRLKGRLYLADGIPVGDEFLISPTQTDGWASPQVAMNDDGLFVVVFELMDADGDGLGIFGRTFEADGLPREDEFQVNTYTTGHQWITSVDMDSTGRFVVVWTSNDQDGDQQGVYGQKFNELALPQGSEFQINVYTTGIQDNPSVAMDENGGFVVTWDSDEQDESSKGVIGARFDSSRNQVGEEFIVNINTSEAQYISAVAMSPEGLFVVMWNSEDQDGNGTGVFGRLFECVVHEDCDDGNVCTINFCDSNGMCRKLNNSMPCDDGVFCNGEDTCSESECAIHAGDPCADNGLYCDGDESCDEDGDQCLSSGDPCVDNGLFCDGEEVCVEDTDECLSIGDPCEEDEICDEENDECDDVTDDDIDDDADDDVNDDADDDLNDDLDDDADDDGNDDADDDDSTSIDDDIDAGDDDDDDDDGCCGC